MTRHFVILSSLMLMLVSCGSTGPQTPANVQEIDTVAQSLLFTNQLLVEQTNRDLALFVKNCGTDFALHDYGFWYRYLKHTDNKKINNDESVTVHYQVWLMDSTKCMDIIKDVKVGKKEVPNAIDHLLPMMRIGEKTEIIAPWYCAYGQKGEDCVLPYTNVRIQVEIPENDDLMI